MVPFEKGEQQRDLVAVFRGLIVAAMGCFFGCFRVKDASQLVSHSKEHLVSRNRGSLSSLFISQGKGEGNDLENEVENQDAGTPKPELDLKALRDQAKFLKACGTLPGTPPEIQEISVKCKDPSSPTRDVEPVKCNSWPSDTTAQKLNLNLLPDDCSTPCKTSGLEKQSGLLVDTHSSCMTDGKNSQSLSKSCIHGSGSSNTPTSIEVNAHQDHKDTTSKAAQISATGARYMNKSVHFDCVSNLSAESSEGSSSALDNQNRKQPVFSGNYYASKNSPFPTPIKLTDEMQTPGTLFPAYLDSIANGNRIRSQYLNPGLNPENGPRQLNELLDEDSNSTQDSSSILLSSNMTETGERPTDASFSTELGNFGLREASTDKESKFEASLSKSCIHGSGSSNTTASVEVNALQDHKDTASKASPISAPGAQYMKSVDSNLSAESSEGSSSALDNQNRKQPVFSGNYYASKNSLFPIPLKLTDEMQTPGTVSPTDLDSIINGKAARIRSQYLDPGLNPENSQRQLNELLDEDSNSIQDSSSILLSSNMTELGNFGLREASADKEPKLEASLSAWLKPPPINQEESRPHIGPVYGDNGCYGRTPGDRPILGLVAAHWKDDDSSCRSPKWWDGNGIPNSTHKYKEDQKVSWHATPFEERLEKALSQETSTPQRKQLSGTTPITFNENEEPNTALSQVR